MVRRDASSYMTIYFPDPRLKARVEHEARRLGLSASNLAGNLIDAVIGVVEKTPLAQIGEIGRQLEEATTSGEPDGADDPELPEENGDGQEEAGPEGESEADDAG